MSSAKKAKDKNGSGDDRIRYAEFKVLLRPERLRRILQAYDLWQHARCAVERMNVRFVPRGGWRGSGAAVQLGIP